jgi:DNA repair protein RecO
MYHVHVTEGIVLKKRGVGEANTLVYVLTHELGLVRGVARSTRVSQSKLRYGLEPLTKARYSFVKGKHEWRLVQVEKIERLVPTPAVGRVTNLLLRLIHGQEPMRELYADVCEGFTALLAASPVSESVEAVLVLRMLSHLGYLPRVEALAPFVEQEFSIELAAKAMESRSLLIKTINASLQASGL